MGPAGEKTTRHEETVILMCSLWQRVFVVHLITVFVPNKFELCSCLTETHAFCSLAVFGQHGASSKCTCFRLTGEQLIVAPTSLTVLDNLEVSRVCQTGGWLLLVT